MVDSRVNSGFWSNRRTTILRPRGGPDCAAFPWILRRASRFREIASQRLARLGEVEATTRTGGIVQEHQKTSERVWLTYAEAAELTRLHRSTLWRAVRRGDLRAGGIDSAPRFHVDDVDEFMRRGGVGRDG